MGYHSYVKLPEGNHPKTWFRLGSNVIFGGMVLPCITISHNFGMIKDMATVEHGWMPILSCILIEIYKSIEETQALQIPDWRVRQLWSMSLNFLSVFPTRPFFLVREKDLSTEEDSFAAVAEAAITHRNNNGPPMDKDMSWIQGIDSSHLLCLLWIKSYAPFWSFTQQRRWNHQPGFAAYIELIHPICFQLFVGEKMLHLHFGLLHMPPNHWTVKPPNKNCTLEKKNMQRISNSGNSHTLFAAYYTLWWLRLWTITIFNSYIICMWTI